MWNSICQYIQHSTPLLYLTQSVWRDEAFSVLVALRDPLEIVKISATDFSSPLYYLLLHYWIKLWGHSEISVRLLSFIFHLGSVCFVYRLAQLIGEEVSASAKKFAAFMGVFVAFNPMLLYYAFEARSYSLLVFVSAASLYYLLKQKKFAYIVTSALGMYAHYYFFLVFLIQSVYLLKEKGVNKDLFTSGWLLSPVLFIPWLPAFLDQLIGLKENWYAAVTINTWKFSLGSLFTGYSGNPPGLEIYIKLLTFGFIATGIYVLYKKVSFRQIFLSITFIPPLIVLFLSAVKPFWVNRYLLFVALGESFIIGLAVLSLPKRLRNILYFMIILSLVIFNLGFVKYKTKPDYRTPLIKFKNQTQTVDTLAVTDALVLFETKYYLLNSGIKVRYYNPNQQYLPRYLGTAIIGKEDVLARLPRKKDIYLFDRDASLRRLEVK